MNKLLLSLNLLLCASALAMDEGPEDAIVIEDAIEEINTVAGEAYQTISELPSSPQKEQLRQKFNEKMQEIDAQFPPTVDMQDTISRHRVEALKRNLFLLNYVPCVLDNQMLEGAQQPSSACPTVQVPLSIVDNSSNVQVGNGPDGASENNSSFSDASATGGATSSTSSSVPPSSIPSPDEKPKPFVKNELRKTIPVPFLLKAGGGAAAVVTVVSIVAYSAVQYRKRSVQKNLEEPSVDMASQLQVEHIPLEANA